MKQRNPTQARCTQCVAMISAIKRHDDIALRLIALLPELESHAHDDLDCGGAIVGEKHAGEFVARTECDQLLCELGRGSIGETEKRRVGHEIELLADGGIDRGMRVAVDVGPDGGVAVDVLATVLISKHAAFSTDEDERLMVIGTPRLHRSEGMPEMGFVGEGEVGGHRASIAQLYRCSRKNRKCGRGALLLASQVFIVGSLHRLCVCLEGDAFLE